MFDMYKDDRNIQWQQREGSSLFYKQEIDVIEDGPSEVQVRGIVSWRVSMSIERLHGKY
jgi:hypothetical protein